MRKVALFLSLVLLIVSSPVLANQIKTIDRPADIPSFLGYAPGQLIVQYATPMDKGSISRSASGNLSVGIGSIDAIAEKYEVTDMRQLFHGATPKYINGQVHDLSRHFVVEFDPQADLEEVYQAYLNDPGIESVEK
ncbi:MAG: hypothetical protein GY841_05625, partial [FCB group bacterium]|nr:hypothetical protein [FCB group bacterium]